MRVRLSNLEVPVRSTCCSEMVRLQTDIFETLRNQKWLLRIWIVFHLVRLPFNNDIWSWNEKFLRVCANGILAACTRSQYLHCQSWISRNNFQLFCGNRLIEYGSRRSYFKHVCTFLRHPVQLHPFFLSNWKFQAIYRLNDQSKYALNLRDQRRNISISNFLIFSMFSKF
jgi:hypothetical protein